MRQASLGPAMTPEQRTAAMVDAHRRRRERDLIEVGNWPNGVAPFAGLPLFRLRALSSRGLVEVRFHLTPEGKREVERLRVAARKPG